MEPFRLTDNRDPEEMLRFYEAHSEALRDRIHELEQENRRLRSENQRLIGHDWRITSEKLLEALR